jgi:hypothetical protein
MAVGSGGVINRVNTTNGFADGVVAFGGVAGAGVVDLDNGIIPAGTFIITQGGDFLITQGDDFLVTN